MHSGDNGLVVTWQVDGTATSSDGGGVTMAGDDTASSGGDGDGSPPVVLLRRWQRRTSMSPRQAGGQAASGWVCERWPGRRVGGEVGERVGERGANGREGERIDLYSSRLHSPKQLKEDQSPSSLNLPSLDSSVSSDLAPDSESHAPFQAYAPPPLSTTSPCCSRLAPQITPLPRDTLPQPSVAPPAPSSPHLEHVPSRSASPNLPPQRLATPKPLPCFAEEQEAELACKLTRPQRVLSCRVLGGRARLGTASGQAVGHDTKPAQPRAARKRWSARGHRPLAQRVAWSRAGAARRGRRGGATARGGSPPPPTKQPLRRRRRGRTPPPPAPTPWRTWRPAPPRPARRRSASDRPSPTPRQAPRSKKRKHLCTSPVFSDNRRRRCAHRRRHPPTTPPRSTKFAATDDQFAASDGKRTAPKTPSPSSCCCRDRHKQQSATRFAQLRRPAQGAAQRQRLEQLQQQPRNNIVSEAGEAAAATAEAPAAASSKQQTAGNRNSTAGLAEEKPPAPSEKTGRAAPLKTSDRARRASPRGDVGADGVPADGVQSPRAAAGVRPHAQGQLQQLSSDERDQPHDVQMRAFFKDGCGARRRAEGLRAAARARAWPQAGPAARGTPHASPRMRAGRGYAAPKPPQLVYFENELTRLMKTVPGIRDDQRDANSRRAAPQVREIVEYLSSEDAWSDSYDSSDYTSSDLEGAGAAAAAYCATPPCVSVASLSSVGVSFLPYGPTASSPPRRRRCRRFPPTGKSLGTVRPALRDADRRGPLCPLWEGNSAVSTSPARSRARRGTGGPIGARPNCIAKTTRCRHVGEEEGG
ncbi:uncharacterized protein GBIM_15752 [Gryllus bimaculatus]|nr:uncharacterized protein GBIM_15752 [Gryllus bimaculatus]